MVSRDSINYSKERLAMLYRMSQAFSSSLELEEVLNKVMDEVIAATNAERGFVTLVNPDGELEFKAARGLDHNTINQPEFEISTGVIAKVTQDGKAILASDAQQDARFGDRQSVFDLNLRSIMVSPLSVKGEIIGVIYVDNRLQSGIFTEDDLELLNALSSSAAVAIENARLYEVAIEKGRMERELQMARKVQSSLIPSSLPELSGWEIAASWIPAQEVSGDFYDFIKIGSEKYGLVIADVVDKGMAAALFMANSRSSLRSSVIKAKSPKEAVSDANYVISADNAHGMFLTLVYAQIEANSNEVTYVNAGHNPPLLWNQKKNALSDFSSTGMLVGVDSSNEYAEKTITMLAGDFAVFFTDGVTEAFNEQKEEYGPERLEGVILNHNLKSSAEILHALEMSLGRFTKEAEPSDDITIVVLKRV